MGRVKGTYAQTDRMFRLIDRLSSRRIGMSLIDLGAELDVSERQIKRDLQALEARGRKLEWFKQGRVVCVRLAESSSRKVDVTRSERFTLLADLQTLEVLEGTFIHADHESLCEKLLAGLPEAERAEVDTFHRRFAFIPDGGVVSYKGKEDLIDELYTGALNKRFVRYTYRSASGREERGVFAPFGIAFHQNAILFVGPRVDEETAAGKKPITERSGPFSAGRFVAAECIARSRFDVPDDFDVKSIFEGSLGVNIGKEVGELQRVTVEFSSTIKARILERTYHPTQKVEHLKNGRIRVSFLLRNVHIEWWVLQFGRDARVLEPAELVDGMADHVRALAVAYHGQVFGKGGSVA